MDKEVLCLLSEICEAITTITAVMECDADKYTSLAELGIKFNRYTYWLRDRAHKHRVMDEACAKQLTPTPADD